MRSPSKDWSWSKVKPPKEPDDVYLCQLCCMEIYGHMDQRIMLRRGACCKCTWTAYTLAP